MPKIDWETVGTEPQTPVQKIVVKDTQPRTGKKHDPAPLDLIRTICRKYMGTKKRWTEGCTEPDYLDVKAVLDWVDHEKHVQ
jgi:hypothetical protein